MKKKLIVLLSIVVLSAGLTACGSNDNKVTEKQGGSTVQQPKEDTNEQTKVTPTGKTVDVTIHAKNFNFDVKEIKAHVGDKVKVTLVNDDGAHGFGIDEYGVDIKGGQTAEFLADKKGTFDFYCTLMCGVGHDKMTGKLIVE